MKFCFYNNFTYIHIASFSASKNLPCTGAQTVYFFLIYQEFEEEQEEEGKTFVPADRCTESDKVNDLRSLQRKLGETLILFVKKQKDSETWEALHAEATNTNETLQQVC